MSSYTVAENVIDADFSLNHRSIQGSKFNADFLVIGDGTDILVRYEEANPSERGVAQINWAFSAVLQGEQGFAAG